MDKIRIALPNGCFLTAECDKDSPFDKEIYLCIEDKDGSVIQDLAVVRNAYSLEGPGVEWIPNKYEVMVYADKDVEDYTDKFVIGQYEEIN